MKISINVRVKYSVEHLLAMILCLRRQTYENWEAVIVTDGPNKPAKDLIYQLKDPRLIFIETPTPLGFWGHPYRDLGISYCTGDWIGLTNDDNYYVPGYLKKMTDAIKSSPKIKMVMCDMLHKEFQWMMCMCEPIITRCDLGNWLVRAEIAKSTPWPGNDVADDGRYVEQIAAKADGVYMIHIPLFIKN